MMKVEIFFLILNIIPLDQIICGMGVGGRIGADGDMRLVM